MIKVIKKSLPAMILSGLVIAVVLSSSTWLGSEYYSTPSIITKIVTPQDGLNVSHVVQINGSYANTDKNNELWILVQPVQHPNYFPQPSKIPKRSNNKWSAIAYIGSPSITSNDNFMIHLVKANFDAITIFKNYLLRSAQRNNWIGLPDLPTGVTVIDSINVSR